MGILVTDSFDDGLTEHKWDTATGYTLRDASFGGTNSSISLPTDTNGAYLQKLLNGTEDTYYVGLRTRTNVTSRALRYFYFLLAGTPSVQLTNLGSTAYYLWINTTTISFVTRINPDPNAWIYLEAKIYFHSTDGYVELWEDGNSVYKWSNLNTGSPPDEFRINANVASGSTTSSVRYFDDIYLMDNSGPYNQRLGPVRIYVATPTADGVYTDATPSEPATPNYDLVNDDPYDSNTYASLNTDDKETYLHAFNLGSIIRGINQVVAIRSSDLQPYQVVPLMVDDSATPNEAEAATPFSFDSNFYVGTHVWEINPFTGGGWNSGDVGNISIGIRQL